MEEWVTVCLDVKTADALIKLIRQHLEVLEDHGGQMADAERAWCLHTAVILGADSPSVGLIESGRLLLDAMHGRCGSRLFASATRSRKLIWDGDSVSVAPPWHAGSGEYRGPLSGISGPSDASK